VTPEPQPLPTPVPPGDSVFVQDGQQVPVEVQPKPQDKGLTVTGDGWSMDLDGLGPDGKPLNLAPDGALILNQERDVQTSGTGFQADSVVDLYIDPPVLLQRGTTGSWLRDLVLRATEAVYVGTVTVGAGGSFEGTATLPEGIEPGEHVLQAVGFSPSGQTRALSLGVIVSPWILLDKGTRTANGMHDRIRTGGTSAGVPSGAKLTPYIRYAGQSAFSKGKASISVEAEGTFTWTRQIKKGRVITAYVSYTDTKSNEVVWLKVK
jgi:hypothetical protein